MIASPQVATAWQPLPAAPSAPIEAPPRAPAAERAPRRRPHTAPLATLAHELRGPLHSLSASATVLVEDIDELSPEQIKQMARAIQRRALWLQGLTENLL